MVSLNGLHQESPKTRPATGMEREMTEPELLRRQERRLLSSIDWDLRSSDSAELAAARRRLNNWLTTTSPLPPTEPNGLYYAMARATIDMATLALSDFRLSKTRDFGTSQVRTNLYFARAIISTFANSEQDEVIAPAIMLESLHLLLERLEVAIRDNRAPSLTWWQGNGPLTSLDGNAIESAVQSFGPSDYLHSVLGGLVDLQTHSSLAADFDEFVSELLDSGKTVHLSIGSDIPNYGVAWAVDIPSGISLAPGRSLWNLRIVPTETGTAYLTLATNRNDKEISTLWFASKAAQLFAQRVLERGLAQAIQLPDTLDITIGLLERHRTRIVSETH